MRILSTIGRFKSLISESFKRNVAIWSMHTPALTFVGWWPLLSSSRATDRWSRTDLGLVFSITLYNKLLQRKRSCLVGTMLQAHSLHSRHVTTILQSDCPCAMWDKEIRVQQFWTDPFMAQAYYNTLYYDLAIYTVMYIHSMFTILTHCHKTIETLLKVLKLCSDKN